MLIRTAGLEIQGHRIPGQPGLFLGKNGLAGWDRLPASRRNAEDRPNDHGQTDSPTYLPSRVVTATGYLYGRDPWDLGNMIDQVNGIGASGDRELFTVDNLERLRFAYGRRVLAAAQQSSRAQHRGEFEIQMVFANPRKFEAAERYPREGGTATSVAIRSTGNFAAHPRIVLPSAPSSYSISSPGGTFTVSGAPSGGTHEVDLATGRVTRNGVYIGLGSGDLWAIPRGAAWVHTLPVPGYGEIYPTFV